MPSNHLILWHPLLLLPSIFPSIEVFSNELALHIRWPKYWSFSISPSNEHSGLISFRIDWFDFLAVQGTLKSLLQHHSSKASIFQCSAFFMVQLLHPYMITRKPQLWLYIYVCVYIYIYKTCGSAGKESAFNVGDLGSTPGLGRSPGEGKCYPLHYSGLENAMRCIVHGVAKSRTQLREFHFHFDLQSNAIPIDTGSKMLYKSNRQGFSGNSAQNGWPVSNHKKTFSSVQFSRSVVSDFLWPYELQHARPPCPSPTPGFHPNSCPSSWWCHPAISSSVIPFSSCPQLDKLRIILQDNWLCSFKRSRPRNTKNQELFQIIGD